MDGLFGGEGETSRYFEGRGTLTFFEAEIKNSIETNRRTISYFSLAFEWVRNASVESLGTLAIRTHVDVEFAVQACMNDALQGEEKLLKKNKHNCRWKSLKIEIFEATVSDPNF